ncbi:MAG: hypothetical protein J6U31_02545 [Bacteroidales bacterium]|nr:hypothetical protein [Bacteroidales bacterium]
MKTSLNKLAIATLLSCATFGLQAQALRTGYFSESYIYRHQINPALANEDGYVSFPILGQMGASVGTNFGVKDLIYKRADGSLTTFMNDEVSSNKFHNNVTKNPMLNAEYDMTLISVGFNTTHAYNTIELGLHTRVGLTIDKDLLYFMKDMKSDVTYDLSDTKATGMMWADLAYGQSRQITDQLRVGAKVKFLFGLAYADANLDGSYTRFGTDSWIVNSKGTLNIAAGGEMTTKDYTNEMSGYDDAKGGLAGFGMAFDLGATYDFNDIVPGLSASAALTDLGWLKWDCAQAAADNRQFSFDGFNSLKLHDGEGTVTNGKSGYTDGSIDEQMKRIEDDLEDMAKFEVVSQSKKVSESIGATATIGAEYKLPVYPKISFGALYNQRFSKAFGYAEGRLVVNYAPSHIFDMAFSGTASTFGAGIGGILNLHVTGFNIFLGVDRLYVGAVNSDNVPLEKCSSAVSFGMNFPFGRSKK